MNRRREKSKRRNSKKKKFGVLKGFLLVIVTVLLSALIVVGVYAANLLTKVDTTEIKKEDLLINEQVSELPYTSGYLNVAIFGVDSREGELEENTLSDTIMVASLNYETKEVKIVSVYRDTILNLTSGSYEKCNSAYMYGGPTQAINMLNANLDLNIDRYISVDFSILVDLIDALGGIEIEIAEDEIDAINEYILETANVAGKEPTYIEEPGLQLLDGVQATTYSRIRKTAGGDFKRTDRQRYVIEQLFAKVLDSNLATINELVNLALPRISTNFSEAEMAMYAALYLDFSLGETTGFPELVEDANVPGLGSTVVPATLESNVEQLHEFLFEVEDYEPSSAVKNYSAKIVSLTSPYTTGVANSNQMYETFSQNSVTTQTSDEDEEDADEMGVDASTQNDETKPSIEFNNPEITFN